jgi:hypothetical protein
VLQRPGLDDLIVETDLVDEQAYPAVDLLRAYDERWTIEEYQPHCTSSACFYRPAA